MSLNYVPESTLPMLTLTKRPLRSWTITYHEVALLAGRVHFASPKLRNKKAPPQGEAL